MNFTILKNFFGIRIQVKLREQLILGTLPIFLILLLWAFTTSGRHDIIQLPEGTFEGWETKAPPDGTKFKDKIRYSIDNCSLDFAQNDDGTDVTWLLKGGQKFKISNLPARPHQGGVRLTLPVGRIYQWEKLPIEAAVVENTDNNTGERVQQETGTTKIRETRDPSQTLPIENNSPDFADSDDAEKNDTQNGHDNSAEKAVKEDEQTPIDASLPLKEEDRGDFSLKLFYQYEVVESRIFAPVILPSPWEVFRSLPALWSERNLPLNLLNSFLRVGAGFLVAFIIVFPVSLLMGTFSKFKALFAPLMLFGGYLPIPALVPLTMSLFGTSEQQKVMFLALGFAIYLLPLFVKSLEEVDNVYLQTAYTLGAQKYQLLNRVLLPIAMPGMFDAMRLGFGIGWGYIILAEMVDMGSHGVGTLILTSQRRGPREDIYLVLIAIVVMAFITDKIWEKVGIRLFPYRSQER